MLYCAVVEDEQENRSIMNAYLQRFSEEMRYWVRPFFFSDAASFLACERAFDLVLLDIRMPGMNGMDAAHILRERDKEVQIIFITSLAAYALQGYEVGALDFIVKPVSYADFALKLMRAIGRLPDRRTYIRIHGRGTMQRLCTDDIYYLESEEHDVIYHTTDGPVRRRARLSDCEKELPKEFCRTNTCYVVNLLHVSALIRDELLVNGERLRISGPRMAAVRRQYETVCTAGGGETE